MYTATLRACALCAVPWLLPQPGVLAAAAPAGHATDEGPGEAVEMEILDWRGGGEFLRTMRLLVDEVDEGAASRRLGAGAARARRAAGSTAGTGDLLDALWDRRKWRDARFNITAAPNEHPCFAGFQSMIRDTDRCGGWMRQYPSVGGKVTFRNTGVGRWSGFTLRAVVADHINVWLEDGTTELHADVSVKAARIYSNDFGIEELRPAAGSASWMEHECNVMGSMPFHYTCSDRINILVQLCGVENAWVMQSDYLRNFPGPATNTSGPNHDIVFYMCLELIDRNPNPYAAANTFAHELAHVIQGGFGFSFNAMTEGGATWLEGPLLGLPPRPMVYAYGFRDWNRINAAHIYGNTVPANARKFYQIHAMFLTYLSQEELLGDAATSALQNYQTFDDAHVPWGRMAYDYFLAHVGLGRPTEFAPVPLDTKDPHNAFATSLLDYRVALAAQCIEDPALRPGEARYLVPLQLRDRPFWDCSAFPAFWSATSGFVHRASMELHYGGAAIYRIAAPQNATIFLAEDADPLVRTKVLAAGSVAGDAVAEVRELAPGQRATFAGGARELFVVQVNVDPMGEMASSRLWQRSSYRCTGACSGRAWTTAAGGGRPYPNSALAGLRSPLVRLPAEEATLSFLATWDLEPEAPNAGYAAQGCLAKGYDGVQVRLHTYGAAPEAVDDHAEGDSVVVLQPGVGYGQEPHGAEAVWALAQSGLYPPSAPCGDLAGWTGRDGAWPAFTLQNFSLAPYAGQTVRVEVLFASDSSVGREGFWLDDLKIRAGSQVLLADDSAMFEHAFRQAPEAGSLGPVDGVPVVAQIPQGDLPDRALQKASETRSAPWSATWDQASRRVSLHRRDGKRLAVDGAMGDKGQFELIHNADGTVSLRSEGGQFVTAKPSGLLSASRGAPADSARLELATGSNGTIALRSPQRGYVAAAVNGDASNDLQALDSWGLTLAYEPPSPGAPESALRREYLGWSYSAPAQQTKTAVLHPWQEACVRLEAPFKGALRSVTLFSLVDKIGVGAVTLTVRAARVPHEALLTLASPSPGVEDPGVHRFRLAGAPVLLEGNGFLLCVGAVAVNPLPADGGGEPFLHLPLTNVSTAAQAGRPGATFLRTAQNHGLERAGDVSGLDPWGGHTLSLRAEFVEAPAVPAPAAASGFLAKERGPELHP